MIKQIDVPNFQKLVGFGALVAVGLSFANQDDAGLFFDLGALEGARIEKQFCQEKHPEFDAKNAAAFLASPYSKTTGEELIASKTTGDTKTKLLAQLPQLRADIRERYVRLNPQGLKNVCASYAIGLEETARHSTAPSR
jgi:hypothetical protein